jgi:hypothetical protein
VMSHLRVLIMIFFHALIPSLTRPAAVPQGRGGG